MRLICPNCGAQYEVPDDVIPESGRDVQCSNCGDTWFQHHPNHPPAEADAEDEAETVVDEPASPPEPEIEDEPEVAAEAASEDVDESEDAAERDDQEQTDADEDEADEPAAIPPRRELDPAIASILREEAQHEEKERARESRGGIETQPDLGLNVAEPDERAKQARERMARLRGESADEAAQVETVGADDIDPDSRRNLLPDIEEISSSLDADRDHAVPAPVTDSGEMAVQVKSGGFGRGFITGVLIVAIVSSIYLLAPIIADKVPALEPVMTSYVMVIDSIRIMMHDLVGGVVGWFRDMSAPAG